MAKYIVHGKEYEIPATFTLGEYAEMERITGQAYDIDSPGFLGGLARLYMTIKRVDPNVKLSDLEELDLADVQIKGDDVVPPTQGASVEPNENAPSLIEGSGSDSAEAQDVTLAPTGTPV